MEKNSYFMRVLFWEEDKLEKAPVLIKIPMTVLSPSPSMLKLLIALETFYGVECYLTIPNIQEISDEKIGITPFGVATSEAMLVTTCFDNLQFLCAITSTYGEYELLALSKNGGFEALMVDQKLADYLGLQYIEKATNMHREYLKALGCNTPEYVYFPRALY